MTILIIYILSFLYSSDTIHYPEKSPIYHPSLKNDQKLKTQNLFQSDEYWDDDRIIFSTYFGGSGYDCFNDADIDSEGNIVQVGYTGSPDFPMIGNSFQNVKNLNYDMCIVKWNPDGEVIWSTFLGGLGADVLYSIEIDKNDDIIVAGRTESPDIIVSNDAIQSKYQDKSDFYIAKFSKNGDYIWSTYWGASQEEVQVRLALDEFGNIYIGGNTKSNFLPTNENAYQRTMEKVWKLNADNFTKSGVYLSKFSPNGNHIWGTYFSTPTWHYDSFGVKSSLCMTEFLTGIDVYEDEIALSWDLEQYYIRNGVHLFQIVTEDAEQKEGIHGAGWQTQVFKIDTAGTKLKYGTFYSTDQSLSKNIKYDSKGNLYLMVGIKERQIPRKDEIFDFKEKDGYLTFVKYNSKNELEWDFGYGCSDDSGSFFDFNIDENNILWTVGVTSCTKLNQSENPFPSEWGPNSGSGYLFVLDLNKYNHWLSYIDIGLTNSYSVEIYNNQLHISGFSRVLRTKNAYQPNTKDMTIESGKLLKLNMNNVFDYGYTSGLDTIDDNSIIIYPNPTNEIININSENLLIIELFDIFGNKLLEDYNTKLDIKHLRPGTYYIRYLGQTRMVVKL